MAGGPVVPVSAVPLGTSGHVYPVMYDGAGSITDRTEMLGVANATTITADVVWHLVFRMPQVLPSGTAKLRLWSRAAVTSGDVKVNPKWKSVASGEDPSTGALNAEGTSTITWGSGDSDVYKETKIDLDADTVVAGEVIHMHLTFEDTGMTIADESGHLAEIIWE